MVEVTGMQFIEQLICEGKIIAIIIRRQYNREGIGFFTPPEFSQQLAYMKHYTGEKIQEHTHYLQSRIVEHTQETLFIKKGVVRVDFYRDDKTFFDSRILYDGDVILLASGGHGFEFLEETEIIEVKQGPYRGDQGKVRFEGVR
jgi:mannose-6-phosphate isomerase-like protein (cupin superfamily)